MHYSSVNERTIDFQYRNLLTDILTNGESEPTRQGLDALTLLQKTMKFDLRNGFPMITERSMGSFWRKPIAELCAFINGATTVDELADFGCDWWGNWTTEDKTRARGLEPGDIGPGSYGGAWHDFPTSTGEGFDQFKHVVEQIAEFPRDRTHFITPWIPHYLARGSGKTPLSTIAPCHGWVHIRVLGERLHLHMYQRSGDVPVGVPSNMVQYAALILMLDQITGFDAGIYYHTISDAHIYRDQVEAAQKMVVRDPRPFPTVQLTSHGRAISDIHDFRAEHFELSDYDPHKFFRVPVAT